MSYYDPALLESLGIYGGTPDEQAANLAAQVPGTGGPTISPGTPYTTPTSGAAIITAALKNYGLEMTPELAAYANGLRTAYGSDVGGITSQLTNDVTDPSNPLGAAVNVKYPELKVRRDANMTPISVSDAINYRDTVSKTMSEYGIPTSFYDSPDDWAKMQAADLSPLEIQHRVVQGYNAALQADPGVRNQLATLYGVDTGQLAAYYLDPVRHEPELQRQFASAQASAGALTGGYQLSASEAERAAGMGMTEGQAQTAFGTLTNSRELFNPLAGGQATQDVIGRDAQINAALGDQAAQDAINRQAAARKAVFGAGGGFATAATGVSGLGTANTG